jgi:hypothetical protein
MTENTQQTMTPHMFDSGHLSDYALFTIGIAVIVLLYHALSGGLAGLPGRPQLPQGPDGHQQFIWGQPNGPGLKSEIWPLWGQLVVPSLTGIALGLAAIGLLALVLVALRKNQ